MDGFDLEPWDLLKTGDESSSWVELELQIIHRFIVTFVKYEIKSQVNVLKMLVLVYYHRRDVFLITMYCVWLRVHCLEILDLHWQILLSLNTHCLCLHDWMNWMKTLILKDNTTPYCLTLFPCGGPCHLSSVSLISNNQCCYQPTKKPYLPTPDQKYKGFFSSFFCNLSVLTL